MRLAISIITNRDHHPIFSGCFAGLIMHLTRHGRDYGVESFTVNSNYRISLLSKGRQDALGFGLNGGFTHTLLLDDDMAFPPDTMEILASRNVQAIGSNYLTRDGNNHCVAFGDDKNRIDSRGRTGIQEVARIGLGIFLLDLEAIRNIPPPHFEILWNPAIQNYEGEDMYFCDKLRGHGIKIHVDHDASQKVGHVGDFVYRLNTGGS